VIILRSRYRGEQSATPELPEPLHNIEVLNLSYSSLEGREFLYMIPSQKPSVLKELRLQKVRGLTQDDMTAFLAHAAPTLRTLYLCGCQFSPSMKSSSLHFIDEVMPLCNVLHDLYVLDCPGIITLASLRLKPTRIQGSSFSYYNPIELDDILEVLMGSISFNIMVRWRYPGHCNA
jgi:hypothetical protein